MKRPSIISPNRNKKTKLELSRKLTLSPTYKPKFEGLKTLEILSILVGKDVMVCPKCKKGKLQEKYSLPPGLHHNYRETECILKSLFSGEGEGVPKTSYFHKNICLRM